MSLAGFDLGSWQRSTNYPQETRPAAEWSRGQSSPSQPLPWSPVGDQVTQAYLSKTRYHRINYQHVTGSPATQAVEGEIWAEFWPLQTLESSSARSQCFRNPWKWLRSAWALIVEEDRWQGFLSAFRWDQTIRPNLWRMGSYPEIPHWGKVSNVGLGRIQHLEIWREQVKGGSFF